ncbi:hypothetical protein KKG71_06950 [Patescibacteria group bacterium]|nr:hypothetical protein [Patescibacteria group bacterium]
MDFQNIKKDIKNFSDRCNIYNDLLSESRDHYMPDLVRNLDEIKKQRSQLNRRYGALEKYLKKLGKNPWMSDGVNPERYPVYANAFSNDVYIRVGRSLDMVLQDLDYVLGRLDNMNEEDFKCLFTKTNKKILSKKAVLLKYTNPFWLIYIIAKCILRYKYIVLIVTIITLVGVDYTMAWKNVSWCLNKLVVIKANLFSFF